MRIRVGIIPSADWSVVASVGVHLIPALSFYTALEIVDYGESTEARRVVRLNFFVVSLTLQIGKIWI